MLIWPGKNYGHVVGESRGI